jgi:DNA-binding response OmpR family regulator
MAHEKIVIIDDDTTYLGLLSDLLQEEGYQVRGCTTSKKAHSFVQHEQPDLIILDLYLEKRDSGLTILQMLRLDPSTTTIPVLVCSADGHFLKQKQEQFQKYHCDILEKPFNINDLLAKIHKNLHSSE